jgi:purine catabolism regulator
VLAYAAHGRPAAELLADWERRSRLASSWTAVPVGGETPWGRLVLPRSALDAEATRTVAERACEALQLARMIERERFGVQFLAQGGVIGELAAGRFATEKDALSAATALGMRAVGAYVPVVVRPTAGGSVWDVHAARQAAAERIAHAAAVVGSPALTGMWGEAGVAALLGLVRGGEDALLERFCAVLARDRPGETVGVGPGGGILAAGRGISEAARAAEVAASLGGPERPYYRAAELRIHGLLAQLAGDARVQAFVESELAALLAHDARTRDGLLPLLRLAVRHTNKSELARAAHLSRPALYARLRKIEEIAGICLDDADSRLSLHVALLAYDQQT